MRHPTEVCTTQVAEPYHCSATLEVLLKPGTFKILHFDGHVFLRHIKCFAQWIPEQCQTTTCLPKALEAPTHRMLGDPKVRPEARRGWFKRGTTLCWINCINSKCTDTAEHHRCLFVMPQRHFKACFFEVLHPQSTVRDDGGQRVPKNLMATVLFIKQAECTMQILPRFADIEHTRARGGDVGGGA